MARAAAASGALVAGRALVPGVVFAGNDGEAVFEMRLPRSGGAFAAGGGWRSGAIRATRRFELLGLETQAADAGIAVRVRDPGGRWSDWIDAPAGHGHGPDAAGDDGGALTDPVWTGPAQVFEVRAKRPLQGARVVLVDGGAPAGAASAKRYVDASLPAGPGQPPIIARSAWATSACKPRVAPGLGEIDLAFVHHTVTTNYYSSGQSAGLVRSICLFHKFGNGWNDIGYNFVIDRYGQVFEARAGGIDEAVVGAQAGGYNLYSTGVALLGTFTGYGPTRRTFDALAHLLAWKLSIHGLELPGTTVVQVSKDGAPYSRYRAGARVTLNRIAGHRDGDATTCPGSGMYRQLPRLRQVAQQLAGTPSALSLQIAGSAPGSVTVAGGLASAGTAIAGATVEIQRRSTAAGPRTLATTTTNPDGGWSAVLPLTTNAPLRAVFRGDDAHAAVVSPGVDALVPPQVTLTAAAPLVPPGGVIEFDGTTAPAKGKAKITLTVSQLQPDGTYAPIRTIKLTANQDGTFSRTIGFAAAGQYQVIAQTPADSKNAAGASAPVTVTVA
jgi:N-acetylmuramoyl-L-alanine amidase